MFKPEKSKSILFVFVMIWFTLNWFFVIAPYSQVKTAFQDAPGFVQKNILNKYPDDLVIDVKSGRVSINQPSPYCLVADEKNNSGIVFDIDASSTPDPKNLEKDGKYSNLCTPLAIVGQEYVLYPDKDSTFKITKIGSDMNFNVDKPSITKFVDQYLPSFLTLGKSFYFIGSFILALLSFLFFLLVNTWYSMVVKFLIKVFKIKTSISQDKIFNLTLFYYTCILAVDWIVFGYLIKTVAGIVTINTEFFMRNTILISLLSLYYLTSHPITPETQTQSSLTSPPDLGARK